MTTDQTKIDELLQTGEQKNIDQAILLLEGFARKETINDRFGILSVTGLRAWQKSLFLIVEIRWFFALSFILRFFFETPFEKKYSLGSIFDGIREEENRVWISYPFLNRPNPYFWGTVSSISLCILKRWRFVFFLNTVTSRFELKNLKIGWEQ